MNRAEGVEHARIHQQYYCSPVLFHFYTGTINLQEAYEGLFCMNVIFKLCLGYDIQQASVMNEINYSSVLFSAIAVHMRSYNPMASSQLNGTGPELMLLTTCVCNL